MITNERRLPTFLLKQQSFVDVLDFSESFISGYVGYIVFVFGPLLLIPDTEVLKKAGVQSVHTLLKLAQLRWMSHVTRMPDERPPKKVRYREIKKGQCSHSGQKTKTPFKTR